MPAQDHRDRVEFTVAAARRENAEREAGARAAHPLISTAAMLGASALAELARELHDAIDVGAPERWPALLGRIDAVQSDVDVRVTECLRAAPSHEQATG